MMESGDSNGDKSHHLLGIVAAVAEGKKETAALVQKLNPMIPDNRAVSKKPAEQAQK